MNPTRCRISLAPEFENLPALERFIFECDFLSQTEKNRSVLIATEYFDNIVSHSKPASSGCVTIFLSKNAATGKALIQIRYATLNFREMIRASRTTKPHYDTSDRRYRGLGLRMCGNLARDIKYRKGLLKSSIIIIL